MSGIAVEGRAEVSEEGKDEKTDDHDRADADGHTVSEACVNGGAIFPRLDKVSIGKTEGAMPSLATASEGKTFLARSPIGIFGEESLLLKSVVTKCFPPALEF